MRHVPQLMAHRPHVRGAQNRDAAAGGVRQTSERAQKCRLPRSIVAEDYIEPSWSKFSADAAQRGKAAELLDQRSQRNDGRSVHVIGRYHVGAGALTRPAERSSARFGKGLTMDQK